MFAWRWAPAFWPRPPWAWPLFVPRRRWVAMAEPFRGVRNRQWPLAMTAWAAGLWHEATQSGPPVFDDMRPFDEF